LTKNVGNTPKNADEKISATFPKNVDVKKYWQRLKKIKSQSTWILGDLSQLSGLFWTFMGRAGSWVENSWAGSTHS
jgi:hypothetical protein